MENFKDIWNRDRDGKNAQQRSFIRYAVVITAAFILFLGFFNQNNIVRWVKAGFEIRRQEKQIEQYTREIEEMDGRIRSLTSSKDSLERFARETFLFAEPGDDVFVIEEKK
ncbi:MAG: septum formation initiator family protein [Candidatus Cryptobacteroides sp.]